MKFTPWSDLCIEGPQGVEPVEGPDSRRGKLPEIRAEEDTITFLLTVGLPTGITGSLLLRCDRDGEIYASIAPVTPKNRR
jgi:hypothetical protein